MSLVPGTEKRWKLPHLSFLHSRLPSSFGRNKTSLLRLRQELYSVASVPEASVISILSLHFIVLLENAARLGEVTSCTEPLAAILFSSGTAELLELRVPEEFTSKHLRKTRTALKTMLLKCLLTCWGAALVASSSPSPRCPYAESIWVRSAGTGEALPGGVSGLCTHVCPGENLFLL